MKARRNKERQQNINREKPQIKMVDKREKINNIKKQRRKLRENEIETEKK